jgi:transposase
VMERVGRDASPTAAIIDSQSAKTTEAGGPRGYDAGKKINRRKRHACEHPRPRWWRTASACLAARLPVHPAHLRRRRICREKVTRATSIAVEIVRKSPDQIDFAVNPRRWVVERFFAWIGRNRRLAKDFEATIDSARAFLYAASVMLLVRRIARAS